jgi:hypothetical protein
MGSVRLYGATSGYLELQAPDVAPDSTLVLPSDSLQPGLVHLHTESFSAVSSVSIDDVFSSTYDNYLVSLSADLAAGANYTLRARMRNAGTTDTATTFYNRYITSASTGTSVSAGAISSWTYGVVATAGAVSPYQCDTTINVFSPYKSNNTLLQAQTAGQYMTWYNSLHPSTSSYDGLTIFTESSTMSGSIRIYGYRNS